MEVEEYMRKVEIDVNFFNEHGCQEPNSSRIVDEKRMSIHLAADLSDNTSC